MTCFGCYQKRYQRDALPPAETVGEGFFLIILLLHGRCTPGLVVCTVTEAAVKKRL